MKKKLFIIVADFETLKIIDTDNRLTCEIQQSFMGTHS